MPSIDKKIFTRGYLSGLVNAPIEDGVLRFTTDTGQLFFDVTNEDKSTNRIEITDFVKNLTEDEIKASLAPLDKIYISKDTHKMLINIDGNWVICGEENIDDYISDVNLEGNVLRFSYGNNTTKDISFADIIIGDFKGASSTEDGVNGLVPAPLAGDQDKYLKANGTWTEITHVDSSTNSDEATHAVSADKAKEADHSAKSDNSSEADHAKEADHSLSSDSASKADESTHATNSDNAINDANGNRINTTYAPLISPIFSGAPTAPDAAESDSSNQIANTKFVANAIANAIAGVTQFDTEILDQLPSTGVKGKIYFVANNSGESENIYDEYIWVNGKFECLGPHKLDLSDYINSVETTGTGNAVTSITKSGNKVIVNKGATFLTEHPSVTTTSGTTTASPAFGGTVTVIDGLEKDKYGHVTNYKTKTITIPSGLGTASASGLTKLYASTGSNSDGTITQKAITEALNGKASSTHNHDGVYQPKGSYASANHTHDLSAMINNLSEGTDTPSDADYYVSQFAGGGTSQTAYFRRPVSSLWNYIKGKADSVYQPKGNYASSTHYHKIIQDIGNSQNLTFAYSKAGLNYEEYIWLAAWNGTELRAVHKNQFATANHTHNYLPLSGGTLSGNMTFDAIGDNASSYGLYWSGSTDGASIYYRTDGADAGRLVLNIADDSNARIDFALNGTTKSYIDANGNFSGNASSASKVTEVVDYGANTGSTIKIGYSGNGITGDDIKFIAGYTTGDGSGVNAKIKDVSKSALQSWLGLGTLAYANSATISEESTFDCGSI